MPEELARLYGGLGFAGPVVYSNFVESLDGVVTLGSKPSAGSEISGRNQGDRFLMALLRACADAVLLGAGTLRATPGHRWTAEHVFPALTRTFDELRAALGRQAAPRLVVVTAGGDVPATHPAVVAGATVITTAAGAGRLRGRLPDSCDIVEIGASGSVDMKRAVAAMRDRGYDVILTEGGPHVIADLLKDQLLNEAFITISPVIAGRDAEVRLGMVQGVEMLPGRGLWVRLLSARRQGDFLFLRYAVKP